MIFFETWQELVRIFVSALVVYPFVIVSVRIAGKRSTAKMNNFDWIVTVAMGSIVGSAILLKDVVIAEAVLAILVLLALQFIVTKGSIRVPWISNAVRARPTLLFYAGNFDDDATESERISRGDIEAAVRDSGYADLSQIGAVVLEADASLSVLPRIDGPAGLLATVRKGAS